MSHRLLHVLGAGDLGVGPVEYPTTLQDLEEQLATGDRPGVLVELGRTRSEVEHRAGPPLIRVLRELDHTEVLLVATNQDHPGDTIGHARILEGLTVDEWTQLVGRPITVTIVECRAFSLGEFVERVSGAVASLDGESSLDLVLSGAVQMVVWTFLGAVAGSQLPMLLDPHGQQLQRVTLDVDDGLVPLLARLRQFRAIAQLDPAEWPSGATQVDLELAEDAVALVDPVPGDLDEQVRRLARSMYARLDRGDHSGISLIRPVLQAAYALRHGIVSNPANPPVRLQTDAMTDQLFGRRRLGRQERMERAALEPLLDWADRSASVLSDFLPEELRSRAHWVSDRLSVDRIHRFVPFPRQSDPVFGRLGFPGWPAVRSGTPEFVDLPEGIDEDMPAADELWFGDDEQAWSSVPYALVLMAVGERDYAPMHEAILRALSYPDVVIFPSAVTQATLDPAHRQHIGALLDPGDVVANLTKVTNGLLSRRPQPSAADRVVVAVGPGTLAMNFALIVGGLDYAQRNGLPFHVASLQRVGPGGAGGLESQFVVDRDRAAARLVSDDRLAGVIVGLVRRLRFDLALEVVRSRGSIDLERRVAARIEDLRDRVFGGDHTVANLAARLVVLESTAVHDPWWSVLAACELVQRALDNDRRDQRTFRDSSLWRFGNLGPFGSDPHADPTNVGEGTAAEVIVRYRRDADLPADRTLLDEVAGFSV